MTSARRRSPGHAVRMTISRSQTEATTARSWLTKIIAIDRSATRPRSRRGSAPGHVCRARSSARRTATGPARCQRGGDHDALPHAAGKLVRPRPDPALRAVDPHLRRGRGDCTRADADVPGWCRAMSGHEPPILIVGFSAVAGSWKTMAARQRRSTWPCGSMPVAAVQGRPQGQALPAAGLPDDALGLPASTSKSIPATSSTSSSRTRRRSRTRQVGLRTIMRAPRSCNPSPSRAKPRAEPDGQTGKDRQQILVLM